MPAQDSSGARAELRLERLTWPQVASRRRAGWNTVLLPLGATEQHGPHLPLDTDSRIAAAVAERAARRLGRALVAPVLPLGASEEHRDFAGSMSLSHETVAALVVDCCRGLLARGFALVAVLSAHGGNETALREVAHSLAGEPVLVVDQEVEFSPAALLAKRGIDPARSGAHAGLAETSMLLALDPASVRRTRYAAGYVGSLDEVWPVLRRSGLKAVTANGVLGDPRGASAALGRACLEAWAAAVAAAVERRRAAL